jgi:CMP-N-acetylneuraminic acid synthetase
MQSKTIGVFLPGRLSSKRLPNKLILPIGETNLWKIALEKLNSLPDDVEKAVLVCDEELIKAASKYPRIKIIKRSEESSQADGPLNFIYSDVKDMNSSHLIFLNPCLLFFKTNTLIRFINLFKDIPYDYATSVKMFKNWIFDSQSNPLNYIDYNNLNTKDISPLYAAAHCFHAFNKVEFLKDGMMLKPKHLIYTIPEEECIDVDTSFDYKLAKTLWELK